MNLMKHLSPLWTPGDRRLAWRQVLSFIGTGLLIAVLALLMLLGG